MVEQDEITKAQDNLLKAYMGGIESRFSKTNNPKKKRYILNSLDDLLEDFDEKLKELNFDYEGARKLRKSLGISLRKLSTQIGVSPQTINNYERGMYSGTSDNFIKYSSWYEEAKKDKK